MLGNCKYIYLPVYKICKDLVLSCLRAWFIYHPERRATGGKCFNPWEKDKSSIVSIFLPLTSTMNSAHELLIASVAAM